MLSGSVSAIVGGKTCHLAATLPEILFEGLSSRENPPADHESGLSCGASTVDSEVRLQPESRTRSTTISLWLPGTMPDSTRIESKGRLPLSKVPPARE